MAIGRKRFQGVANIVRFNWHFYVLALVSLTVLLLFKSFLPHALHPFITTGVIVVCGVMIISLFVSFYIYDLSGLYRLEWLDPYINKVDTKILNINAGFDESSLLIKHRFSQVDLSMGDFYDPVKHTEISIKRARQVYPKLPGTLFIQSDKLPFSENTFDLCLAIMSAHEIRDKEERIQFFKELNRVSRSSGLVIVLEHLRDLNNFLAYTLGFFHFYSRKTWLTTFKQAGLSLKSERKLTPFLSLFILEANGTKY
ncbi:MAG TPA: methyltransferase [Bacteroidetes bacterium]|nr:methyltransferase [Bacteroidota bacterium]